MPLSAALNDPKIALNGTPVKPVAVISEKEKIVPDQETRVSSPPTYF